MRLSQASNGFVDRFGPESGVVTGFALANQALTRDALTVSALNRAVAGLLARSFPLVRVRGEMANFTRAASGHWYFTLKDDAAQVRCAMFRGRNALVNFAPREGDAVEVLAQVSLYEARGEFQLTIEALERSGLGRLYEEFLRLKARLASEGLFDEARKRALPSVPKAVGVVTSLQAAALRDVLTALRRRASYLRIVVYPVPVQGEGSAQRIAEMLDRASSRAEVDVLLLVRGGGSIEDLWAFNEEAVARAIRASAIPVVVGVGHESDFTIADFAADVRAATPTAAAEIAAPTQASLTEAVTQRVRQLQRGVQHRIDASGQRLDLALRVLVSPRAPLVGVEARLQALRTRLRFGAATRAAFAGAALARIFGALAPLRPAVREKHLMLNRHCAALGGAVRRAHDRQAQRVESAVRALGHLDPLAVLERGYSLVRDASGDLVRSADAISAGDGIDLTFARGGATARIERTRS